MKRIRVTFSVAHGAYVIEKKSFASLFKWGIVRGKKSESSGTYDLVFQDVVKAIDYADKMAFAYYPVEAVVEGKKSKDEFLTGIVVDKLSGK